MRRRDNERGAAAVEFALVLPVLILLLFGIIEFGAAYNAQILVTNAAREAARTMAVTGVESDAIAAADAALEPIGLDVTADDIEFTVTPTGACTSPSRLNVLLTVDKPFLTGLFGAKVTLSGKATRQCGG